MSARIVKINVNDGLEEGAVSTNPRKNNDEPYKPHILMIVMDDLGSHDLGMHGTGIQTPTSDRLAADGIYLDNYYVLPYCSPTRAALLSGKYPLHSGVHEVIQSISTAGLPLKDQTLPEMLARGGYESHAVGKWHIGHSSWEQTPTFRGFQSFYGFYHGSEDYFSHSHGGGYDFRYDRQARCGDGCSQNVDERGNYSTHVFTREAIRVIQEYATEEESKIDKQEDEDEPNTSPLFLYLAFQAVHCPNEVPQEYMDLYKNQTEWTDQRKNYAGMLTAADEGLANVTLALQNAGLWDDTLIVFTTDNGGPTITGCVQGSSNYPKRGGKHSLWEGGTTGDGFVSGPALQKLGLQRNRRFQHLFHVVDWFPTLAELVGVVPQNVDELDGKSQLESLKNGDIATRQELYVGYCFTGSWYGPAIRYQNWKIVQGTTAGPDQFDPNTKGSRHPQPGGLINSTYLLFDLETDPLEEINVAEQYPLVLETMIYKLQQYHKHLSRHSRIMMRHVHFRVWSMIKQLDLHGELTACLYTCQLYPSQKCSRLCLLTPFSVCPYVIPGCLGAILCKKLLFILSSSTLLLLADLS